MLVLKKTTKAIKEALKVMIESWTSHGTSFNKLTFDGEVRYNWAIPSTKEAQ